MPDLSFNQRQQLVQSAIQKSRGVQLYVVELYDDRAVYEEYDEGTSWQVPYTIDGDEVTLGDRVEVQREVTYRAVKFADGSDNIIEGLAIPFGGPFAGKDFDGEDFGPDTDIAADWFPSEGRPVIYHHGLDDGLKTALVGRQIEREERDAGHWVKVQLDKRNRYFEKIAQMVGDGALSFSSGAIPHLVQTRKDGHIERWPWVELSLTPTPANVFAGVYTVKSSDAIEHIAAVKAAIPDALKEAIDESLDASLAGLSYADHADRVLADMKALVIRTQEIADLRAKAKRRISAATRERLSAVRDQAQQVIGDIDGLLVDADSEASKATRAQYLSFLRDELRASGVPV